MPRPNAAWRLTARSMHDVVGVLEDLGVAVGGRERQQHPVARATSGSPPNSVSSATSRAIVTGA